MARYCYKQSGIIVVKYDFVWRVRRVGCATSERESLTSSCEINGAQKCSEMPKFKSDPRVGWLSTMQRTN